MKTSFKEEDSSWFHRVTFLKTVICEWIVRPHGNQPKNMTRKNKWSLIVLKPTVNDCELECLNLSRYVAISHRASAMSTKISITMGRVEPS